MPLITRNTFEAEIIGGIYAKHGNADNTEEASLHLEIPVQNVQVAFPLSNMQAREAFTEALVKAIRNGTIQTDSDNVTNMVPVVEATTMGPTPHGMAQKYR